MRTAILTDTGSGFSEKSASDLGIHLLNLKFRLDDVEFNENDMTDDKYYTLLQNATTIQTSQPSLKEITDTYDDLLKNYDNIIYIPLTKGYSGVYSSASMLANEDKYKDRVYVVDSKKVSVLQKYNVFDCIKLIDKGYKPNEVKDILEKNKDNATLYVLLNTLEYLKKGGRINPLVANIGNLLQIKVIVYSDGDPFDVYKKTRSLVQGNDYLLEAISNDMKNRFKDENLNDYSIGFAYTSDEGLADNLKARFVEKFGTPSREIIVDELSKVIVCHIGFDALGIAVYKNFV